MIDVYTVHAQTIHEGHQMKSSRKKGNPPIMNGKKGYHTLEVYNEIKHRIISLGLKPGQILEEKKMADELGVGRTPVREALLMLKNADWIVSLPNKSAYVKEISLKDIKDLFESLAFVERQVSCLAAQRMTPEALENIKKAERETAMAVTRRDIWEIESYNQRFHQLIAEASDNQYLASIHRDLRSKAERLAYLSIGRDIEKAATLEEHFKKLKQDHRDIVSCLEAGDAERLERLSVEHIWLFQNRIVTYLSHGSDITSSLY
jgi:DNA-binding GntR family transcriptional regulator